MSYLLFTDESGHDHHHCPYEVRGGIALHAGRMWDFVRQMKELELDCFGAPLHSYKSEIKGEKLLKKKRFRLAAQRSRPFTNTDARNLSLSLLKKGVHGHKPSMDELTAYGQSSCRMAEGVFDILLENKARLFASVIPKGAKPPTDYHLHDYLRKDQIFMLERFFYFLEERQDHGLLVMDETERQNDRTFVRRITDYFTKTENGKERTAWIVPYPLFVASDMAYPVQAADICIYCINWGMRIPRIGMNAPLRNEIRSKFELKLRRLQWSGEGYDRSSRKTFSTHGVVYVPDPYKSRE